MSDKMLGIFLIIAGALIFLFKKPIVKHRMRIYIMLNNIEEQKKVIQAERIYRFSVIFGSIVLIIIGIKYLLF